MIKNLTALVSKKKEVTKETITLNETPDCSDNEEKKRHMDKYVTMSDVQKPAGGESQNADFDQFGFAKMIQNL